MAEENQGEIPRTPLKNAAPKIRRRGVLGMTIIV